MDCLTANREELAEKYVQGKLDPSRQDEFETHLLECAKCMQELELLQAMRQDLAERAHEIRGWTASKPFFRWQTAVLAMVLVMVLAVGIKQLRESKKENESAEVLAKKQGSQPQPLVAEAPKSEAPEESSGSAPAQSKISIVQTARKEPTNVAPHQALSAAPATAEPSTPDSQKRVAAKPTQPLPAAEVPAAQVNSQIAANANPGTTPSDAQPTFTLTTAQGVELYHLGNVVAPPFTFAGFSSKRLLSGAGATNSHSQGGQAADSDRKLFRDGMTSYVNGNYKEAGEFLEQAAKVEPNAGDVQYYLGLCQLLNGNPQSAIDALRRAATLNSAARKQGAHYYLAKAYLQTMKLQEAEYEFLTASEMPGPLKGDSAVLLARLKTLRAQLGTN